MNETLKDFEEFHPTSSKYNMVISLGQSERFFFGNAFEKKYELKKMKGVKLLWNKEKRAVGFKFVEEKEDGMLPMKTLSNGSYYINGKSFLGTYDLDANKEHGKFKPDVFEDKGVRIFIINLLSQRKK